MKASQTLVNEAGGRRDGAVDKVEVSTDESVYGRVSAGDCLDELSVERKIAPRFQIEVEELKGAMKSGGRGVAAKLSVPLSNRGGVTPMFHHI